MNSIKMCLFSDFHYDPGVNPWGLESMQAIYDRAIAEQADLWAHCGDFMVTTEEKGKPLFDFFYRNPAGLPAFGCVGNHELQQLDSLEQLERLWGVENNYYYRDFKGFRLVFTDTNYFYIDGELRHYPGHSVGGPDWSYDHNCLGREQLDWLRDTLEHSPYPCIVFSHAAYQVDGQFRDPKIGSANSGAMDARAVRAIFREVNDAHPGRVLLSVNGHYHTDSFAVVDGVGYLNLNAVHSGFWSLDHHKLFPKEFTDRYPHADQCAYYVRPLSAIVTLGEDGDLDIQGSKSDYMYGVTAAMCDPEMKGIIFGTKEPRIITTHVRL